MATVTTAATSDHVGRLRLRRRRRRLRRAATATRRKPVWWAWAGRPCAPGRGWTRTGRRVSADVRPRSSAAVLADTAAAVPADTAAAVPPTWPRAACRSTAACDRASRRPRWFPGRRCWRSRRPLERPLDACRRRRPAVEIRVRATPIWPGTRPADGPPPCPGPEATAGKCTLRWRSG